MIKKLIYQLLLIFLGEEISFQIIETRKEYLIKKLSIMNGLSFFKK